MKHRIVHLALFVAMMLIGTHLVIAAVSEFDDPELTELLVEFEDSEEDFERDIGISGFFDMEFNKLDTSNSTLNPLISDEGTFSNSHLNIYFDSQVSPRFRFFSEVRLLNQPSTLFTEENLADRFQGSLSIERAWVDWNYRNQLNIRVGKFLTPYGIWNVEHGGPILISTRTPLLLRKQLFPESVAGVQVYGKIFPANFQLSYYAWIGNGKGPSAALQDANEDKAIGGRIAIRLPLRQKIELGISAYRGDVTQAEFIPTQDLMGRIGQVFDAEVETPSVMSDGNDMSKMDNMDGMNGMDNMNQTDMSDMNQMDKTNGMIDTDMPKMDKTDGMNNMDMPDMPQMDDMDDMNQMDDMDDMNQMDMSNMNQMDGMDMSGMSPILMERFMSRGFTARGEPLDGYTDQAIGLDLSLELSHFEIQGEVVINSVDPFGNTVPKFREISGYGQVAYGIWTSAGKVTPFVRAGFSDPNDKLDLEIGELRIVTFGLNYKPTTGVVLKTEFHLHRFENDARNFPMFANSLSVAF